MKLITNLIAKYLLKNSGLKEMLISQVFTLIIDLAKDARAKFVTEFMAKMPAEVKTRFSQKEIDELTNDLIKFLEKVQKFALSIEG